MAVQKKRHLAKAITWRIVGTTDTFVLAWVLTGDPKIGLTFSGLELISKTLLYYLHERAWYKTRWGLTVDRK